MKASGWMKLIIFLVLAGSAGAGAWYWMHDSKEPQYQTQPLARGEIISTISSTGNCNAVVTVQVGSQVSGNIKELYADFNTKVTKGQLVALIDPELFNAKVDQARAKVESDSASIANAKANQQKVEADIASAQANLENQKANVARARVTMMDAKSKMDHDNELFKRGIVSQEERDTAQATYDSAVASLQAAQAMVSSAEHAIKAVQAQRQVAMAQVASALAMTSQSTAMLQQSLTDLKHTKIMAPVDGTVVARKMDVGQTVAASFSAPTIFEIAQDLTKMQVDANVDEADIGQIREGQETTFKVDAYPGEEFSGKVVQLRKSPLITSNVVTYDVVIAVPNDDLKLYPGMTANVSILVDRRADALKLPNAALRVKLGEEKTPPSGSVGGLGKKSVAAQDGAATSSTRSAADAGGRKGRGDGSGRGRRGGSGGGGGGGRGDRAQAGGDSGGRGARGGGDAASSSVWVLGADGKPRKLTLKLGISDGYFTEIQGGELKEGDSVIVGVIMPKETAGASGMGRPPGMGSSPGMGGGRGMRF